MKLLYALLLILATNTAFCQTNTCELSDAINVPQTGWNKLVMMRNGNTVLFHLELYKPIIVKVFNKEHKEIATQKHFCDVFKIDMLDQATFKGLYDINGEAVLFLQQEIENKETLIRIRFNADDGKIIEEKPMLQSISNSKRTDYYVLKQNTIDTYAVFCYRNTYWHPETKPEVIYFNAKHEIFSTIPVNIDIKDCTIMQLVGADIDTYGNICITTYLANIAISSARFRTAYDNEPRMFNKYLNFIFIPKNGNSFIGTTTKINKEIVPSYTNFCYNPFAKSLNLLLLQSKSTLVKNGINTVVNLSQSALLFVIDGDSSLQNNWISYDKINKLLYHDDTTQSYSGIPIKMFTASNGLTTLVSEGYVANEDLENGYIVPTTELNGIGVTRLNDKGEELSGVVIPKAQFIRSTFYPADLSHKDVNKRLFVKQHFKNLPQMDFVNQFASINTYESGKNLFIVYNDDKRNFSTTGATVDSVYDFAYSDGMYCRINRKNEVSKHFLFGEPANNESKSGAVESACFDDKSNTYATLMQYRKGEAVTIHIAWCHLD